MTLAAPRLPWRYRCPRNVEGTTPSGYCLHSIVRRLRGWKWWVMDATRIVCPHCGGLHRVALNSWSTTGDCWLVQRPISGWELR